MRNRSSFFAGAILLCLVATWLVACGGGGEGGASAPPESASSAATAPPASGSAVIHGTVSYSGEVPTMPLIDMGGDAQCAAKHTDPVKNEMLVLGDGNTMGNIYVRVKSGLPAGRWPAPSEPAVLDQKGCQYLPHVLGVVAGQALKILNSDGIMHNVHALPKTNREFNRAMPPSVTEFETTFDKPEESFRIKCDVHPWMGAFIAVSEHPFFSVTGADGKYSITGLPAGTYEIEAWHERLGIQSASVTVGDGQTQTADFTFARP